MVLVVAPVIKVSSMMSPAAVAPPSVNVTALETAVPPALFFNSVVATALSPNTTFSEFSPPTKDVMVAVLPEALS